MIGGLITVAGLSSRMRQFKPLLDIGSKTMIEFSVDNMLKGGVDSVMVVLGYRGDDVRRVLSSDRTRADRIQFSVNRDYAATQMLDSIKVGLSEMRKCDAFFVAPGDMPAISCTTYERLIDSYRIGQRSILFPTLDGYRKHPPLVDASYIPEILEFEGEGMRAFWRAHESEIREIAINDPGCWMDADYPEDLERIKAYLGNR